MSKAKTLKSLKKELPPATAEKPKDQGRGNNITVGTVIPRDVMRQLRIRAAEEDKTIRAIFLESLVKNGFTVDPSEMVDKRK